MSEILYSETDWTAFEALVDANLNQGMWRFEKDLRAFVERVGWDWMPAGDKHLFYRWARVINTHAGRRRHGLFRRKQLQDAGFTLWIISGYDPAFCPAEHSELDGIVLPSDHPFWRDYIPPNDWSCTCHISGARSEASARRRGADPELPLPYWWTEKRGIEPHFQGNHLPKLLEVVELLHGGFFE